MPGSQAIPAVETGRYHLWEGQGYTNPASEFYPIDTAAHIKRQPCSRDM